jgi:phosphoribosyl 1,2-cyclic phosphodiesterase
MKVTLWGTRGSLASPGPETARYGGNTACVEVAGEDGTVLVLDAGTGIRRLGMALCAQGRPVSRRVDVLLSHLHMDHLQGLGFFAPLYNPHLEVHIWGPVSTTMHLRARLTRYLSPPLFPVHLRDLPCSLQLHEVPFGDFRIGPFHVTPQLVCHPGPTVGYRIANAGATICFLPDHEPALGVRDFPQYGGWTSGYDLAAGVDLLIHDAQYTREEYPRHVGWGHSSIEHAIRFAGLTGAKHLVLFHHDPGHTDDDLDQLIEREVAATPPTCPVTPGVEGAVFQLGTEGRQAASGERTAVGTTARGRRVGHGAGS